MTMIDLAPVALGPFVGSFLAVVVVRYPDLRGASVGRSACPACGERIAKRDLVPIVSWVWLRARCRECGAAIGLFYPATEIGAALLAGWSVTLLSGRLLWASCVLGWVLLTLSLIDVRRHELPDFLSLSLLVAGLAVAWFWLGSFQSHIFGAIGGYAALAGIAIAYRALRGREGLGMGDAKLLAAGGAWLGWEALPGVLLVAAGLALVVLASARIVGRGPLTATTRVPFGPFLAAAIWLAWLYGPLELTS